MTKILILAHTVEYARNRLSHADISPYGARVVICTRPSDLDPFPPGTPYVDLLAAPTHPWGEATAGLQPVTLDWVRDALGADDAA